MKILVVDDDRELRTLVGYALRQAGFAVTEAESGEQAWTMWCQEQPALIVLDLNLPDMDGLEVCQRIRKEHKTAPILILTVRDSEEDELRGLSFGADDFLNKPFSPRILIARIQALLRRTGSQNEQVHQAGDLKLLEDLQALSIAEKTPFRLTPLEFSFMQLLLSQKDQPVKTDEILMWVWGHKDAWERQRLKQLVLRLRRKLEADPAKPTRLVTVPEVGYRLVSNPLPP